MVGGLATAVAAREGAEAVLQADGAAWQVAARPLAAEADDGPVLVRKRRSETMPCTCGREGITGLSVLCIRIVAV